MSDDVERLLSEITPRGAPPELRPRILEAVAEDLNAARRPRASRSVLALAAVAAALVLSLALNYQVSRASERRLARILGPIPASRRALELANEIAAITDAETGRWAYERLAPKRGAEQAIPKHARELQRLIHELTLDLPETDDEAPEENPRLDRAVGRRPGGGLPVVRRVLHVEHVQEA